MRQEARACRMSLEEREAAAAPTQSSVKARCSWKRAAMVSKAW